MSRLWYSHSEVNQEVFYDRKVPFRKALSSFRKRQNVFFEGVNNSVSTEALAPKAKHWLIDCENIFFKNGEITVSIHRGFAHKAEHSDMARQVLADSDAPFFFFPPKYAVKSSFY
jgi:hypothetical protein